MKIEQIPFRTIDWETVEPTLHKGETGSATWRTLHFGPVRVRLLEYSPGYMADHWCLKGHFIQCLEGEMTTELQDGRLFRLTKGMTYVVGDNMEAHRSFTEKGAKLFVVD